MKNLGEFHFIKWILLLFVLFLIIGFLFLKFSKNSISNSANASNLVGKNYENLSKNESSDSKNKVILENDPIRNKKIIVINGKNILEGSAIYNQYNPAECLYSIYFSCDYFENGCNDETIMENCINSCIETGGRKFGTGGYLILENAIQCACSQCLSIENGTKDFQIINTRTGCTNIFNSNRIKLEVENVGTSDINKNDWMVHEIDGQSVNVWPFSIKVKEHGLVFSDIDSENYSSGEHFIRLGLNNENIKEMTVICP